MPFLVENDEDQDPGWDFGGLKRPTPAPSATPAPQSAATEWDFGGLTKPKAPFTKKSDPIDTSVAAMHNDPAAFDATMRAGANRQRGAGQQLLDLANRPPTSTPPSVTRGPIPMTPRTPPATGPSIDQLNDSSVPSRSATLSDASPFAADAAALARPPQATGPSMDQVMRSPVPTAPSRMGSAKTGGMATEPAPGASVFDQPGKAIVDTTVGGIQQIGHGAGQIAAAVRDTAPPPVSTAPMQRSRTGALYQPPPALDPRAVGGAADILEGGMAAATPLLVGGLAAAPMETASALVKGVIAAKGAAAVAKGAGLSPEATRVVSATAGALGAGVPLREAIDKAVWSAADKTRAMADAAVARRNPPPTVIPPESTDIAVTPERRRLPQEAPLGQTPTPETRLAQEPPTQAPPVAVRPGVSEAVGPVAPSPEPSPGAPAVSPPPFVNPKPSWLSETIRKGLAPVRSVAGRFEDYLDARDEDRPKLSPERVQQFTDNQLETYLRDTARWRDLVEDPNSIDLLKDFGVISAPPEWTARMVANMASDLRVLDDEARRRRYGMDASTRDRLLNPDKYTGIEPEHAPASKERWDFSGLPAVLGPDAYAGPEKRGTSRVNTPDEDLRYREMRAKVAAGEPTGTPEARAAFEERQRVEAARNEAAVNEVRGDEPKPEGWDTTGLTDHEGKPVEPAPEVPAEPERVSTRRTFSKGYDKTNLHERRELGRMLKEMENIEYTDRTRTVIDTAPKGKDEYWVGGAAGAPVFSDIKGSNRAAVSKAIQAVLDGKTPTAIGERAIGVARKRLDRSGFVSQAMLPPDAADEPGRTYVETTHNMTPDEAKVEQSFREAVENRTDKMVRAYRKRFGNVVSADDAKELSPEYAESTESRAALNRVVHRSSSALAGAVYRRMIQEPPPAGKEPDVVFLAGATGVGKTTVRKDPTFAPIFARAQVVVDGPLTTLGNAEQRIHAALDAGKTVSILYVHQDPTTAWQGVVERGKTEGRQPTLDYHVDSHVGGLTTIRQLAAQFSDDPRVNIEYAVNPRHGTPNLAQASDLPEAYNEQDVRHAIEAAGGSREEAVAAGAEVPRPTGSGHKEPPGPRSEEVRPAEVVAPPAATAPATPVSDTPPREFSSTQVDLPAAVSGHIRKLADSIPDADLGEDGREDKPHVTVKFGLHTDDVADVRRVLAGEKPITVTLGKTSIFPAKEGADYDVVKVDVDSPDLHRLNAKIAGALEHTDTHPDYKPHATIAYVKAGLGKKYAGRTDLEGQTVTLHEITFSRKNREKVSIPLTGTPQADLLDTGESQPRLPGDVGAVRDTEVHTPKEDVPFSLERETASRTPVQPRLTDEPEPKPGGKGGGGGVLSNTGPYKGLPKSPKPAIPVTDRMRPSAIIAKLQKGLGDIPVNVGRFKQQALGIYKQKPQAVRLRVANDLQTVAHELGHHIDHAILGISYKDARWRDELKAMGQATSRPSYTVKQQRMEGAAEFLRMYLIEPATAQADAPVYFAEFERRLDEHPDLKQLLNESREDLAGLIAQDPATRGKLRIDFSGTDSPGIYQRLKDDPKGEMRNLATLWTDDLHALRVAVDEMADARPLDARKNAYVLARNARGTGGMSEGFLEHGVRGRNGRFISGSFADAITPVKDHLEAFASYLTARRVLEVKKLKGKETGMSAEEARGIIKEVEAGPHAADMARAADNVYAYQQGLLQYAREYHALSDDQYQTLLKEAHYVPLQRVMDVVSGAFSGGGARKIANRSSPIKRMKGSGRDIVNPLESIIRNTFAIVDMVEKNRSMQALVRQADAAAGSAKWLELVPAPQIATKFNLSQVEKEIRAELDAAGVDLPDNFDLDAIVKVFTPAQIAMPGQNLVTVIRDGTRQFYEVHDQALYDAITAIGGRASSTLVEWASKPAALLRAGATLTPGFIARNPTRDTLVAFMQSRYGFIPVYDTLRGLLSLARGDEDAKLFLTSGIQQSSLVGADRDRLRKTIRAMSETSRVAFFKNMVLHPVDLLRAISENMESATRLGEFRLAVNAGGTERRAGVLGLVQRLTTPNHRQTDDETLTRGTLAARDVTTDFSRAGSLSREANRVYAFFNARVQGYLRMAETAQRDPTGTVLNVALLALLSYFLWWAHEDEDEYDELPDWEKNAYWHVPILGGYFKVAKPFEWAYMANLTEAALNHVKKQDPSALDRIRPSGDPKDLAFALIPSALTPVLEASFNYDTFRDSPIVKPWDVGLRPDLQKSDWTTDTAVQLGKIMNVSPAKIDHVIFGYGAGFARGVVEHGSDPALRAVGLAPQKADPAKKWQRVPVAGTFYREATFDGSSQSLKEFYQAYQQTLDNERSLARYAKTDRPAGRAFLGDTVGEKWRQQGPALKAAKQQMEGYGEAINAVYAAPLSEATPDQKRRALDRIYEQMVNTARVALGKRPLRAAAGSR